MVGGHVCDSCCEFKHSGSGEVLGNELIDLWVPKASLVLPRWVQIRLILQLPKHGLAFGTRNLSSTTAPVRRHFGDASSAIRDARSGPLTRAPNEASALGQSVSLQLQERLPGHADDPVLERLERSHTRTPVLLYRRAGVSS